MKNKKNISSIFKEASETYRSGNEGQWHRQDFVQGKATTKLRENDFRVTHESIMKFMQ